MKKIMILILVLLLLFFAVSGEKKEKADHETIIQAFKKGEFARALVLTEKKIKEQGLTMELARFKYDALVLMKRLDDALRFIDEAIKQKGESEELISAKYNIYMKQGKWPDALRTALRKEKIARKKSPWDCMNIMHVYLRMGSKADALDWLQEAVNRGFISYRLLAEKKYDLLKNEKRLYEIIKTIHVAIGLGNRSRNFQAKLLSGETFNLWSQRGKVVLVHFWATWCGGCRKDMPGIKKTYDMFKDKNFDIVGISLDTDEKSFKKYITKYKLDWKHVFSGKGWEDPTVIRYGINSVPSYWLVDKRGILRSFGLKGRELSKVVANLLNEK
jgi:peroxiredoxin